MKKVLVFLLIFMFTLLTLTGCGDTSTTSTQTTQSDPEPAQQATKNVGETVNEDITELSGKFTLFAMTEEGVSQTAEQLAAAGLSPDEAYLEFMADNKFQEVFWDDPVETGTYVVSMADNSLDLTYDDGVVIEATIDGNKISFDYGGGTYIFTKN